MVAYIRKLRDALIPGMYPGMDDVLRRLSPDTPLTPHISKSLATQKQVSEASTHSMTSTRVNNSVPSKRPMTTDHYARPPPASSQPVSTTCRTYTAHDSSRPTPSSSHMHSPSSRSAAPPTRPHPTTTPVAHVTPKPDEKVRRTVEVMRTTMIKSLGSRYPAAVIEAAADRLLGAKTPQSGKGGHEDLLYDIMARSLSAIPGLNFKRPADEPQKYQSPSQVQYQNSGNQTSRPRPSTTQNIPAASGRSPIPTTPQRSSLVQLPANPKTPILPPLQPIEEKLSAQFDSDGIEIVDLTDARVRYFPSSAKVAKFHNSLCQLLRQAFFLT